MILLYFGWLLAAYSAQDYLKESNMWSFKTEFNYETFEGVESPPEKENVKCNLLYLEDDLGFSLKIESKSGNYETSSEDEEKRQFIDRFVARHLDEVQRENIEDDEAIEDDFEGDEQLQDEESTSDFGSMYSTEDDMYPDLSCDPEIKILELLSKILGSPLFLCWLVLKLMNSQ